MRGGLALGLMAAGVVQSDRRQGMSTGQTGFVMAAGAGAFYALSQEVLILHAESVVAFCMGTMTYFLYKKAGPGIAESLDERSQEILDRLSVSKNAREANLNEQIADAAAVPAQLGGVANLFDVQRDILKFQQELQVREAKAEIAEQARKHLHNLENAQNEVRAAEQAALVASVRDNVLLGLKGQESAILKQCVVDLEALAAK